jgi:hypothetical protein
MTFPTYLQSFKLKNLSYFPEAIPVHCVQAGYTLGLWRFRQEYKEASTLLLVSTIRPQFQSGDQTYQGFQWPRLDENEYK